MPNIRSEASMTREEVKELVARRVAEEMEAREVARNLETLNENEEEQEGENGGNRGNENGDFSTPYSTQPFMVQLALAAVGESPNIPLSFIVPSRISSGYILPSGILPFEWRLLSTVIPWVTFHPSYILSTPCSITLELLVHQLVSNAYGILVSSWIRSNHIPLNVVW
nr:hypothetical protein [Tanacetum cinerariifolium]